MEVKINGKIFKAYQKKDKRFEIRKNIDMFDLMFFKKMFFVDTIKASEYQIDIPFVSKISRGKFLGCFPCELGENYVIFVYNGIQSV